MRVERRGYRTFVGACWTVAAVAVGSGVSDGSGVARVVSALLSLVAAQQAWRSWRCATVIVEPSGVTVRTTRRTRRVQLADVAGVVVRPVERRFLGAFWTMCLTLRNCTTVPATEFASASGNAPWLMDARAEVDGALVRFRAVAADSE